MSKFMDKDVYNAAFNGVETILSNQNNHDQLLKKTYQNDNIIHIAAHHKQFDFIKAAFNSFPRITCESLLRDQNCLKNTPFHIVTQVMKESEIIDLYDMFFSTQCGDAGGSELEHPLRMVNSDGNTPAHVALLYSKVSVAMYLVEKDSSLARITNDSNETLLHLAIQYHIPVDPESESTSSNEKDLLDIIEVLLKTESSLACWANKNGSTPLHLATSLDPPCRIRVIKAMLASCPEAATVRDERSKQTVLHYLANHQVASDDDSFQLLGIPQIYALRNIKDDQGDTPLHLAARDNESELFRLLAKMCSPFHDLKNKHGVSTGSLARQLDERTRSTKQRPRLTEEEFEAAKRGDVAFLNQLLTDENSAYLGAVTPMGSNILHILLQFIQHNNEDEGMNNEAIVEFIKQIIKKEPLLINLPDRNGNTLLHLLAEKKNVDYLERHYRALLTMVEQEVMNHAKDGAPRFTDGLKNVKGDTPLHVAFKDGNHRFAEVMLSFDYKTASYINDRKQTPYHVLFHNYANRDDYKDYEVEALLSNLGTYDSDVASMQDDDGLTPLLSAVQERNFIAIRKFHKLFPDSTQIADFKGRTLWHLFASPCLKRDVSSSASESDGLVGPTEACKFLIEHDVGGHIMRLMASKDNDGNTPLHLAIENQQFDFALFFLDNWKLEVKREGLFLAPIYGKENEYLDVSDLSCSKEKKYDKLLAIENKRGVSCYDLIGAAEHLPIEFEKALFTTGNLLHGHRSLYSVPTTKIQEYANTIGVIAALLATITFTAAFTVPGGLDSSNGTPLLMQKAAFQVFMVADVVAMCTSMMVLFCLLWILTTGHKKESILLLDVSVFLLKTSFHATLVTFMTGLYVTTISIVPAVAISTCVICTLLIILMHKGLVMWTVVPFFGLLIIWSLKLKSLAKDKLSKLWSSLISKTKCLRSSQNAEADEKLAEVSTVIVSE